MINIKPKRILISLITIAAVAGVAFTAARAFFSDTETSVGNQLTAGELDLKIDSTAHYDGMTCTLVGQEYLWQDEDQNLDNNPRTELIDQPCVGTWPEANLGSEHRFFDLDDAKPGDWGENTISMHVYDNDAWGRFAAIVTEDDENGCNEPELDVETDCEDTNDLFDGELGQALVFGVWLDQGELPGFQNHDGNFPDPLEGNNIQDDTIYEQSIAIPGPVGVDELDNREDYLLAPILQAAYNLGNCQSQPLPHDGHKNYGTCHGLAEDGRLVGSTVYQFGISWSLPTTVGNEAQSDSFVADLVFDVEQHRNNESPFPSPIPTP